MPVGHGTDLCPWAGGAAEGGVRATGPLVPERLRGPPRRPGAPPPPTRPSATVPPPANWGGGWRVVCSPEVATSSTSVWSDQKVCRRRLLLPFVGLRPLRRPDGRVWGDRFRCVRPSRPGSSSSSVPWPSRRCCPSLPPLPRNYPQTTNEYPRTEQCLNSRHPPCRRKIQSL